MIYAFGKTIEIIMKDSVDKINEILSLNIFVKIIEKMTCKDPNSRENPAKIINDELFDYI